MSKATQTTDTCQQHHWCEKGWSHPGVDHYGDNDGQLMTALIETTDRGEAAPAVLVHEGMTARFTWRDVAHRSLDAVLKYDIDRSEVDAYVPSRAIQAAARDTEYGALLLWNRTRDEERGHLVMFTGQTCGQEIQVIESVSWMISCGTVYSASRVGVRSYKADPDFRTRIGGETYLAWLIPNGRDVDGLLR